jgi:glycosyltransferase involved in cell wall biosynthesis
MPDFQHRMMPEFFTRAGWLKRETGFQVQIRSGRYVMVSSDDSRAACEALYPSVRGKVRTVRFAVPPPRTFSPGEIAALKAHYGLPEKFFLMPNQYWAHKNHRTVIGALAILAKRGVRPVVFASGNQDDPRNPNHFRMLEGLVRREGLLDQFKMPGLVPVDDLHGLMAGCEAVVNPSLFEGWSTTVEEARSAGVPLILSDIAVHREQAAQEGVFFRRLDAADLADALEAHASVAPTERAARAVRASTDAHRRVKAFADDFIGLVHDCIG